MRTNKAALALAMVAALTSATPVMAATAPSQDATEVKYTGSYTGKEYYEVTVPALLAPTESGDVTLEGVWSTDITMKVTAPETVDVVNDIDGGVKTLAVEFVDIEEVGDNTKALSFMHRVTVGEITDALIGTWSGNIVFTIGVTETATGADTTLNN